jgi:L-asparaginase II
VAGRNRFDSAVMAAQPGVIVKGGAEGVCAAGVVGADVGIALKVMDGGRRAADVAMAALLNYAGALDSSSLEAMSEFALTPVRNVAGRVVGVIRHAEIE